MSKAEAREAATHDLKVWPEFWADLESGRKPFEVRFAGDRDFRVGDRLRLREWDSERTTSKGVWNNADGYTGREMFRRITYILSGEQWGLSRHYVVLGLDHRAAVWREAEQIARVEAEKMRAAENHPTTELDAVGRYAARWVTATDIADAIAARAKEERGE